MTWWTLDGDGRRAVLEVVGPIGDGSPDLAGQIAALDVDAIEVRIDSPGGSSTVLAAAMALAAHRAHVACTIGRHADSAALLLALGADHRRCHPHASLLVHAGVALDPNDPESDDRADRAVAAWLALRAAPATASAADRDANAAWWLEVMREAGGHGRTFDAVGALAYGLVHDIEGTWAAPGALDEHLSTPDDLPVDVAELVRAEVGRLVTAAL